MRPGLALRAIRRRSLVTGITLVIMFAGVGSYLWLSRSEGPAFILLTVGVALAVGLAVEEIIRLRDWPARRDPPLEAKSEGDAWARRRNSGSPRGR